MSRVKCYIVRFFSGDDIELSREVGQSLIIYLAENPSEKFVMINGNFKNIASIKGIDEDYKVLKEALQNDGTICKIYENREITDREMESQYDFDKYFNNKKLLCR